MTTDRSPKNKSETIFGVIYAGSAFLIWGLSPVYWKALGAVPAMEIIMHRIAWSFVFLVCLIVFDGNEKLRFMAFTQQVGHG